MIEVAISVAIGALFLMAINLFRLQRRAGTGWRLEALSDIDERKLESESTVSAEWGGEELLLESLGDRLGRAGYLTKAERRKAMLIACSIIGGATLVGAVVGVRWSVSAAIFSGAGGAYFGLMCWMFFLRGREQDVERETLFRLPLMLESLILLVEAGLGVLPALERVIREEDEGEATTASRVLGCCYSLTSSGMPFGQSLELVSDYAPQQALRHVLLHLDISGTEGGELIPSLRNLSEFVHNEWKLSVETRVKRLENLVVFPVFASVMGLLVLTSAVPLVPMMDFLDTLNQRQSQAATALNSVEVGDSR